MLDPSSPQPSGAVPSAPPGLRVVLVGPLYGGNVGSICRAMANFGADDLVLVNPSPDIDWREAEMMAVHAAGILAARRVVGSLPEALADCVASVGTTCRRGLYRQHALSAKEWAPELAALSAQGRVALVFGREDQGLFNDEIALCTHLVQIPTASEYRSLNLAQAVCILCYELFQRRDDYEPVREKSPLAPGLLRQRMEEMWRAFLLKIGFMNDQTADHMMAGMQRIFSRGAKTVDDVNILMGVAHQAEWARATLPPKPCHHPEP